MILNLVPGLLGGSAQPGSLLYRHPEYDKRWWWREFGRVSYLGGREYHHPSRLAIDFQYPVVPERNKDGQLVDGGAVKPDVLTQSYKTLLFRHDREQEWQFYNRQKRAYYFNFVRTIVNSLVSQAVKRTPSRTGDSLVTDFQNGVDDRRKTSIDNFMRSGLRWAQVMGLMWACVDVRDRKRGGDGKPYAYWVSPLDILDWDVDDDGEITWLKQFCYAEQAREWNEKITPLYRFRVWYQDRVETYETDQMGIRKGRVKTQSHSAGRVPFVPLYSIRDEDYPFPDGTPLAADLCKGSNHVFNEASLLSEILYKQTFSWLAIPDKTVDVLAMGVNTAFGYDPGTSNAKPEYISPDAKQAEVHMNAIASTLEQLRQSFGVGRGRSEGSMSKSSGVALELESQDKLSILGDIVTEAEDFERRLIDMVMAYRKVTPTKANEPFIYYQREFDMRSLQDEINEALSFRDLQVSRDVNVELAEQLIRRKFAGMEPTQIEKLLKSLEAAPLGAPPPGGPQFPSPTEKVTVLPKGIDTPADLRMGGTNQIPNQPGNAGSGKPPPSNGGSRQPAP